MRVAVVTALILTALSDLRSLRGQQLLADLNPFYTDPDSAPGPFVAFAGGAAFAATTAASGRELWYTRQGTGMAVLLADLAAGAASSDPVHVVSTGAALFFAADDGSGQALWVSDGSFFGTRRLRTLRFAPATAGPQIIAQGTRVLALADDGIAGPELWVSDGTSAGTQLVRELEPGAGGALLVGATVRGNELFAAVRTPHDAPTRWLLLRSDGTAANTTVFADSDAGGPRVVAPLVAAGSYVYFGGSLPTPLDFELWCTDGTPTGTAQVVDLDPQDSSYRGGLLPFRNGVAFLCRVSSYGDEPAVSDGSANGTVVVDVNRLVGRGSTPRDLVAMGGDLYVFGITNAGSGLYRIDGNQLGVTRVASFTYELSPPRQMVAAGSRLFLRGLEPAAQGRTAGQIFVCDGTSAGTSALRDLRAGVADSGFDHLTPIGADVVFRNDDGIFGAEPWWSDGTASNTGIAANVHAGAVVRGRGSDVQFFLRAGLRTVFDADDGDRGREPFVTEGIAGDPRRLADLVPGAAGSRLAALGTTSHGAAFASTPGPPGALVTEYWQTNGTTAGTYRRVPPLLLGPPIASTLARALDDGIVFAAPWLLAGGAGVQGHAVLRLRAEALTLVGQPLSGATLPPRDLLATPGRVFFASGTSATGYEPWTDAGPLLDLRPGALGSAPGATLAATLRGAFLFAADDGSSGSELWRSDGTAAGTRLLAELAAGSASSTPREGCADGDRLFFVADVDGAGAELCISDGTPLGTRLAADVRAGPLGSAPRSLAAQHGGVYFSADDGATGRELWFSDGTANGTRRVADGLPGPLGSNPRALTALGSRRVLFVADDAAEGDEPWVSDGTAAGTQRLAAIWPGAAGSGVLDFHLHPDGRVLFVADDGSNGREPWTYDPGAVAVTLGQPCGVGRATLRASDPVLGTLARVTAVHDSLGILAGVLMLSTPAAGAFAGCELFVDPAQVAVPVSLPLGALRMDLFVPNAPRLLGTVLHMQLLAGVFVMPPGWALSNGVALRLGR